MCPRGRDDRPGEGREALRIRRRRERRRRAREARLLEQLCRRIEHARPGRLGASMKLASSLPLPRLLASLRRGPRAGCVRSAFDARPPRRHLRRHLGAPTALRNRAAAPRRGDPGKGTPAQSTVDIDAMRKICAPWSRRRRRLERSCPSRQRPSVFTTRLRAPTDLGKSDDHRVYRSGWMKLAERIQDEALAPCLGLIAECVVGSRSSSALLALRRMRRSDAVTVRETLYRCRRSAFDRRCPPWRKIVR